MKKTYQLPETILVLTAQEQPMLAASDPEARNITGGPTSANLPSGVDETKNNENPFTDNEGNEKGQGGATTRAKMWDDAWDLPQWWNF